MKPIRFSSRYFGLRLMLFALAFLVIPVSLELTAKLRKPLVGQQIGVSEFGPTLESEWRYTRFGWQKPIDWFRTPSDIGIRLIERVNPILFSIDILLAVVGAMIWASDEWQVRRLFGKLDD